MPKKSDFNVEDLPISKKTGKPYYPRKKRKPTGAPSPEEWEGISRLMFNNIKTQLEDVNEDGLPTAPPALYATVAKIIKDTNTVTKETPKAQGEISELEKQLRKKRESRRLHFEDPVKAAVEAIENPELKAAAERVARKERLLQNSKRQVEENIFDRKGPVEEVPPPNTNNGVDPVGDA